MKINKTKGFTLIELLVVIAVIGILSAVILVGLQNSQKGARDSTRIGDIKQLQNGLELFNTTCGKYPAALAGLINPSADSNCSGGPSSIGIARIPKDAGDNSKNYSYCYDSTSLTYVLGTTLETPNKAIANQIIAGGTAFKCAPQNPSVTCTVSGSQPATGGVYCATI